MRICLLAHSGSTTATLSTIASALAATPGVEIVVIDSSDLNLIAVTPVRWPGPEAVIRVSAREIGLVKIGGERLWGLRLARRLNRLRPVAARQVASARRLLADLNVDLIVTCNDTTPGSIAMLRGAASLGIASVLVQEGPFVAVGPSQVRKRHRLVLAASADYAERYVRSGASPDAVRIVGIPRFDALPAARTVKREGAPRLLYVFQPFVAQRKVHRAPALATLIALAGDLNALHRSRPIELVVRAHPRADAATIAAFTAALDLPFVLDDGGEPFPQAALGCDVAVGHYSIGLLECVALRVPALCWPLPMSSFIDRGEAVKQAWIADTLPSPDAGPAFRMAAEAYLDTGILAPGEIDISAETGRLDKQATRHACAAILEVGATAISDQGTASPSASASNTAR